MIVVWIVGYFLRSAVFQFRSPYHPLRQVLQFCKYPFSKAFLQSFGIPDILFLSGLFRVHRYCHWQESSLYTLWFWHEDMAHGTVRYPLTAAVVEFCVGNRKTWEKVFCVVTGC